MEIGSFIANVIKDPFFLGLSNGFTPFKFFWKYCLHVDKRALWLIENFPNKICLVGILFVIVWINGFGAPREWDCTCGKDGSVWWFVYSCDGGLWWTCWDCVF